MPGQLDEERTGNLCAPVSNILYLQCLPTRLSSLRFINTKLPLSSRRKCIHLPSNQLHDLAIATAQPPPPLTLPPLPPLINPEHTTRKQHQAEQIPEAQRLSLEYVLQPREIDDQDLARETQRYRPVEQGIAE